MNLKKKFNASIIEGLPADAPEGSVKAVISSFGVIDSDGDVVTASAIQDGTPIKIASWGHNWGDLPVGKGVLHNDGERAVFEGQFFLNTQAGRETYETVKALGDLQEWSWGFSVPKGGWTRGEHQGQRVRFINSTVPHEVSPVLVGANPQTGTVDVKGEDAGVDDEGGEPGKAMPMPEDGMPPMDMEAMAAEREGLYATASDSIRALMTLELTPGYRGDEEATGALSCLMDCWQNLQWFMWRERMADEYGNGMGMMGSPSDEEKAARRERLLKDLDALREAGILDAVGDGESPRDLPYAAQAEMVLQTVHAYLTRSRSLADLRAKEGRVLSEANRVRLRAVLDSLSTTTSEIQALLAAAESAQPEAEVTAEVAVTRSLDAERRIRLARARARAFE